MTTSMDVAAASRIVSEHMALTRQANPTLDVALSYIERRCGEWALVGGAPRTWVTGRREPPRDIDVVVSAPHHELVSTLESMVRVSPLLQSLTVSRTSLGGFRMHGPAMSLDIWAARTTLNIAQGRVPSSNIFRSVAYSAPLSLDTLVVTSRGTVYERGFFSSFATGKLTLRDGAVAGAPKLAQKAYSLCRGYGLVPDLILQILIAKHIGKDALEDLTSMVATSSRRLHDSGTATDPD